MDTLDEIVEISNIKNGFRKSTGNYFEFYLSGMIASAEEYTDWFNTIRHAEPNDIVKIYINSTGGYSATAVQFIRVLTETQAHVICSIEGSCISAATMIFLCADEFEITPFSQFMAHNYSGGTYGKGAELYAQAMFDRKWSEDMLRRIYQHFLTEEEIECLIADKDVWLSAGEVADRCQNLANARRVEPAEPDTYATEPVVKKKRKKKNKE